MTDSRPDIDPNILDLEPMVRNFGGLDGPVAELYALFLRNAEALCSDIAAKLAAGETQAARQSAHAAAGAARSAGARRLAALCSAIEETLVRGDSGAAARLASDLAAAIAEVRAALERL